MSCPGARAPRIPLLCLAATLLLGTNVAFAATAYVGEPVMGTVLDVTVVATSPDGARELAHAAIDVARHWDDVLTTWRAQGELAQLNARAGQGPFPISADLALALVRMLALSHATHGAFDPGIGAIVEALRRGDADGRAPAMPSASHIGDVLDLGRGTASLAAHTRLDAGAIGKGIALDAIGAYLRSHDARAWFLDFGGSSQLASGRPENADAWNVLIAGERPDSTHGFVELRSGSLSTSRAAAAFDPAGAIVDPRTATAVTPPRLATVLAPDATSADAWSTALVVLGRGGLEWARAAGVEALVEDAAGTATTPGFPLTRSQHATVNAARDGVAESRPRWPRTGSRGSR